MRNINFIMAASFLLLWAAACSNQVQEIGRLSSKDTKHKLKLEVSMPDKEAKSSSVTTRLQMTETDEGNIAVGWKEGDKINLCFVSEDGNTVKTVTDVPVTNISADGKKADFEINVPDGIVGTFNLYGVYGASFSPVNSTIVLLPTVQNGVALSDNETVSVMRFAATNLTAASSPEVTFSHIGCMLAVWIYNDTQTAVSVGKVTLSSAAYGFNWLNNSSGQATLNVVDNSFIDAKAGSELSYSPSEGTTIAAGGMLKLYSWVVPGEVGDSKFLDIKDINGSTYTEQIPARTMSAGKYYRIKMVWDGTYFKYIKAPSDNDLVGYWPFDGNANDIKGTNNGTLYGNVTLANDRNGNANSAYYFDGNGDYIKCESPSVLGTAARTISFWAKADALSNSFQTIIVYGGTIYDWGGRFEANLLTGELICDISYASLGKTSTAISSGVWNFYTIIFSGGSNKNLLNNVQYYVNGNLLSNICNEHNYNSSIVINTLNKNPIYFGSLFGTERFFKGTIDEVRIYDRALTAYEVKGLYYKER